MTRQVIPSQSLVYSSFFFFFFFPPLNLSSPSTRTRKRYHQYHCTYPHSYQIQSFYLLVVFFNSHTLSSKAAGILLLLLPLSRQVLFQNLIPVKALSCISSMIQHNYFFNFIFTHRSEISSKSHFSTDLICFHNLVIAFFFFFFFLQFQFQ